MVKIGRYDYQKSTKKGKKLMTKVKGKTIHFGNSRYEQYKDRTGIWKDKDHKDEKRRKNYLTRTKGILDGDGNTTYNNPESPNYHARKILWDS